MSILDHQINMTKLKYKKIYSGSKSGSNANGCTKYKLNYWLPINAGSLNSSSAGARSGKNSSNWSRINYMSWSICWAIDPAPIGRGRTI